jgi:NAD(P)-dependent dehydrogenase (short-subunit alcohol dehydrogenase family)
MTVPSGKPVIVITGAASGIGLASAERLASSMTVVLADRDGLKATAAAAALNARGAMAMGVAVDVTNGASVSATMALVRREAGPVYALFNNAGVSCSGRVDEMSESDWDITLNTHVEGAFLCTRAAVPDMLERGKGIIVMMGSDYSVKGMAMGAAYAAAKTALYSLTKTLAREYVAHGIRVNALGPGPIETPLLRDGRSDAQRQDWKHKRAELVPMGRIGAPEEVAAVLEFLVSERSSYMTGQLVHVNGGQISW